MTRLVPAHRRMALIVRSRLKGLGAAAVVPCGVALVALALSNGGFLLLMIGAAIGYTAIPLAMAASHRELIGAETCLWLQKPVREVGFVLMRFRGDARRDRSTVPAFRRPVRWAWPH